MTTHWHSSFSPHHHFTCPFLPSHSPPPLVLTAHSLCPTTPHGVTNDGTLHYMNHVNHLPPFLCEFWCVPQAIASICTDRGGYALWCCLPQKSAMRDIMKRHTLARFAFFHFLSSPFLWRIWESSESPSPPLSTLFTNAIHASVHRKE